MFIIRALLALGRWLLGLDQEKPLQVIDNAKLIHLIKRTGEPGHSVRPVHCHSCRDSVLLPTQGQTN